MKQEKIEIKKVCLICKFPKLLSDFYVCKTGSMGVDSYCKICRRKKTKRWYRRNRKHHLEVSKAWRENNREKVNELKRTWQKNNRKKVNVINRRYYHKKNSEKE